MSDDPLELPLFDAPEPEASDDLNLFDSPASPPPTAPDGAPPDETVVVETLDLEAERSRARAAEVSDRGQRAGLGTRLAAGIIDLLVHVAVTGLLIGGCSLLGVAIGTRQALPLAVVLLLFSFVYHVVPLAFWGHTPGMTVAGLRARTLDDHPLSLPQATRRWLALLLTLATGGLGVLLALGGRSLADRLSRSQTLIH